MVTGKAGDGMIELVMKGRGYLSAKSFNISFRAGAAALFMIVCAIAALTPSTASAATHRRHIKGVKRAKSRGPLVLYHGALLEDAETGKVLFEENGDMEWPPASMAKMMLLLVAYENVKNGRF